MSVGCFIFKAVLLLCVWSLLLVFIKNDFNNQINAYDTNLFDAVESVMIDKNQSPTETQLIEALEKELPNVPFAYWFENVHRNLHMNETCAKYPSPLQLDYYNDYWQSYQSANVSFRLFSAYFDDRFNASIGPVLRLLAMSNETGQVFPPSYCQLWYDNRSEPLFLRVTQYSIIWNRGWGVSEFQPYLLTCNLPPNLTLIPRAVSLVPNECYNASNSLKVQYETYNNSNSKKGRFGVCVKGMNFLYNDLSARLIEWFELLRLLGAQKVYTYDLGVHRNISKVLQYYQQQDFLNIQPLSLPNRAPHLPHIQDMFLRPPSMSVLLTEPLFYTDCFYRNMYKYDFIVLLDVDEVIVPLGNLTNWYDLVTVAEQLQHEQYPDGYSSICYRNVIFPSSLNIVPEAQDIPNYFHMLQHTHRWVNHSSAGVSTKCFHNTSNVVSLHNHLPINCLDRCKILTLDTQHAQLQHYRNWYRSPKEDHYFDDRSLWKYKSQLINSAMTVLRELGFTSNT